MNLDGTRNKVYFFAFSGQGAFKPGFGRKSLCNPIFSSKINDIINISKIDINEYAFGKSSVQTSKMNSRLQITHFALTWAMAHTVAERIGVPQLVFGHSLGEICALIYSGSLSLQDGVSLIIQRGILMEECSKNDLQDLLVVFNGNVEFLQRKITDSYTGNDEIFISNLNSSLQTVIAGKTKSLEKFSLDLSKNHSIKSKLLGVGLAFHSPFMSKANEKLESIIDNLHIYKPNIPFISVKAGRQLIDPEEIRIHLKSHMLDIVNWKQVMDIVKCRAESFTDLKMNISICEIGFAKTLRGLFLTDQPKLDVIHPLEYII